GLDHHPHCGFCAVDLDHRRHRRVLPRAGHHRGRGAAHLAGPGADLDAGAQPIFSGRGRGKAAPAPAPAGASEMEKLLAAEEASLSGFFRGIVGFYERWLRRALARPVWLALMSLALVAASYFCYKALGSDLLPEMDEGGFILDYVMPPGSSLTETNAVLEGVERILRATPEVAS